MDSVRSVHQEKSPMIKRYSSTNLLGLEKQEKKKENKKSPRNEVLKDLLGTYLLTDVPSILRYLADHSEYTLARDRDNFDALSCYGATAHSTRDRLIEYWNDTNYKIRHEQPKRIYYLSIEYLMGRALKNALLNLELEGPYKEAIKHLGYELEEICEHENDAGLGNGGLGRLAACYLDSMATQNYPAWGYGIRYNYGMFKQIIHKGWQAEIPDYWLKTGNPWEIPRSDMKYTVSFYGKSTAYKSEDGLLHFTWLPDEKVMAVANDMPIPGFRTGNTINLRLWSAEPTDEFDLASFNQGNYMQAVATKQKAEAISNVLYPNDNSQEGKELRLKQQYFFASATLQDIIRRFKKHHTDFTKFSELNAIQLNDTHPVISIPELMRLFLDVEGLSWWEAWEIVQKTFNYTNHTVLPEALEKWSINLIEKLLPRHMQIIYEINHQFKVHWFKVPEDNQKFIRLSIIDENEPRSVRMAHLAIIMSTHVNGVAQIHSNILQQSLFKEFHELFPGKFCNVTNGVTQRRWLMLCNPDLTSLISKKLGNDNFLTNLNLLTDLKQFADDKDFQKEWLEVKTKNKKRLISYLEKELNITGISENAFFDIQIKRIHEYKRQLLNILRVIHIYHELLKKIDSVEGNPLDSDFVKNTTQKVIIFGGKAAPGYERAKKIIKLINSVAEVINNDKKIFNLIKVVFIPNYGVSLAELIIPSSDLSEHISTAGTEASGTSNMKFALNGGLIIGTLDGANIEIREEIGTDNMFIFGLQVDEIQSTRDKYFALPVVADPELEAVIDSIEQGEFGDNEIFSDLTQGLLPRNDYYLLGADFKSYLEAHEKVDKDYSDKEKWAKMSICSTAGMGKFSSDRSIKDYATKIWKVEPQSN